MLKNLFGETYLQSSISVYVRPVTTLVRVVLPVYVLPLVVPVIVLVDHAVQSLP